jgi:hypothetical protein
MLNAWLSALNQEHKREEPARDYLSDTSGRLHLTGVTVRPPGDGHKSDEQIHGLTARVDGTGAIRRRLGPRTLSAVKVPVTVAGHLFEYGAFSFGVGSDQDPKLGPHNVGAETGLKKYGGGDVKSGLTKLWNKMKGAKVDDLVGDNKTGGKTDDILGGKDD